MTNADVDHIVDSSKRGWRSSSPLRCVLRYDDVVSVVFVEVSGVSFIIVPVSVL